MEETDVQNMELLQKRISEIGIIPVIKIKDAAGAVPLAQALARGGLPAAEITFRTACAEEAERMVSNGYSSGSAVGAAAGTSSRCSFCVLSK